jgi:predicted transglutaminase-like cysteine proteinase
MRLLLLAALLCGVAYSISEGANARGAATKVSYTQMVVHGSAEPPVGYSEFCNRHPADCRPQGGSASPVAMTTPKWRELHSVNRQVNQLIKPMSDLDQYHTIEYWTYPDSGKGDCEDYVLLKQRRLMELGWPESDLLITVVRDENNEGHAVLSVRTTDGDFVLDNKHSRIARWNATPYTYIKRQSFIDPLRWESLLPVKHSPTVASSGTDSSE